MYGWAQCVDLEAEVTQVGSVFFLVEKEGINEIHVGGQMKLWRNVSSFDD